MPKSSQYVCAVYWFEEVHWEVDEMSPATGFALACFEVDLQGRFHVTTFWLDASFFKKNKTEGFLELNTD